MDIYMQQNYAGKFIGYLCQMEDTLVDFYFVADQGIEAFYDGIPFYRNFNGTSCEEISVANNVLLKTGCFKLEIYYMESSGEHCFYSGMAVRDLKPSAVALNIQDLANIYALVHIPMLVYFFSIFLCGSYFGDYKRHFSFKSHLHNMLRTLCP